MADNYVYSLVDQNAPALRGYDTNAWAPNWGANVINASVTGIFSALASIAGTLSANKVYRYYEQQEQLYIQNAAEQARRIQLKGDIELRNLEIAHKLEQGRNIVGVAGAGGNLSGSYLDMLTTNYKYNVMDERTSSLSTLWEVDNAKRAGYISAIETAGQAMNLAYKNRASALQGLTSFAQSMSSALLKDKRQDIENSARFQITNKTLDYLWRTQVLDRYGANSVSTSTKIEPATTSTDAPILRSSSNSGIAEGLRLNTLMSGYPMPDAVSGWDLLSA